MAALKDLFDWLSDELDAAGVHISSEALQAIVLILLGILAVSILFRVVRGAIEVIADAIEFVRGQVRGRFWRDAGKLTTFLSFLLLLIGYGLFWREQPRTLAYALSAMVRDHLPEIVPTVILTQALLLCAYWLVFGALLGVPARTLVEPFRLFVIFAAVFACMLLASVVLFVLAGGDAEILGVTFLTMITVLGLTIVWVAKLAPRSDTAKKRGNAVRALLIAGIGWLFITALVATTVACVYAGVAHHPTVDGLVATDFAIMTVALLFTCYKFRAYIGGADVPRATGHFIDFSLAISACAIALAGAAGSAVTVGGLPPVVVAAIPALAVAVMLFVVHLRRSRAGTRRWAACLAVAVVAGLLVGPAKQVLAAPISAMASVLPIRWG
jgi:hypothetical protein